MTLSVGIAGRCIGTVLEMIVEGSLLSLSQVIRKKVSEGGSSKIFKSALAASELASLETIAWASAIKNTCMELIDGFL